jgi:hypothetical protein
VCSLRSQPEESAAGRADVLGYFLFASEPFFSGLPPDEFPMGRFGDANQIQQCSSQIPQNPLPTGVERWLQFLQWGRSSVWLERRPVTAEVAGSSPVVPAMIPAIWNRGPRENRDNVNRETAWHLCPVGGASCLNDLRSGLIDGIGQRPGQLHRWLRSTSTWVRCRASSMQARRRSLRAWHRKGHRDRIA